MTRKLNAAHAALLGVILGVGAFITWSAVSASVSMNNLIVVVPVAIVLIVLAVTIIGGALLSSTPSEETSGQPVWGDLMLLTGFAVFCYALTKVGFDIATFLFVWGGVVMSGGRGWWQPPLFSALFTILLVKGFGALFPYPMMTLVF